MSKINIKSYKISNTHLSREFANRERIKLNLLKPKTPKRKKKKRQIDLSNKDCENLQVNYIAFLKTNYWKRIARFIKKRDKHKCCKCGSVKYLVVHHKTYKNHCREHEHLRDLITLCNCCHKIEHNIN